MNQNLGDNQGKIILLIEQFKADQSLKLLGELRNLGVGLKKLNNNKWEDLKEYKLPFIRLIPLYNVEFQICDLGIY